MFVTQTEFLLFHRVGVRQWLRTVRLLEIMLIADIYRVLSSKDTSVSSSKHMSSLADSPLKWALCFGVSILKDEEPEAK